MKVKHLVAMLGDLDQEAVLMVTPGDEGERRPQDYVIEEGADEAELVVLAVGDVKGTLTVTIREPYSL